MHWEAILKFIKATKHTLVYGNEELPAVYLPKHIFKGENIAQVRIIIEKT